MESSWSVEMNMTYWVENRKKGSRNEEIKVEADEPDVQKTESIHIIFWWKTEHEVMLFLINFSTSDTKWAFVFQPLSSRWFSDNLHGAITFVIKRVREGQNRKLTSQITSSSHQSN